MTWRMPEPPIAQPTSNEPRCESCKHPTPAENLTPVHGHGKLCWSCIELERDCA